MVNEISNNDYWEHLTAGPVKGQAYDELLAEHYRNTHLSLISRWADTHSGQSVLKTDLFAEGMSPSRSFFWDVLKTFTSVTGIDVSGTTISQAKINAARYAPDYSPLYVQCDVRRLPFSDNSFDLIISDSTLDHFKSTEDIDVALSEFKRVLVPNGILIITLDNKSNLTEPLFRLWINLGLSPFFIGKTYSIRGLRRAVEKTGLIVNAHTAIIHNPRFFMKAFITILRKIGQNKFDSFIIKSLSILDRLENTRMKYLTAQFIAVKATKNTDK